eukprot:TRINITY_DN12035_c0_g2_i8.p1 TRINITY_DN12035_c0_g2~~TRINITY_DN12035_c0_g2_i8.p1  ORF type:complete len:622 (+),score=80.05 TRINITY_DN12035_c0_g2_i8:442-2307(+)
MHKFECDGIPCSQQSFLMHSFDFTRHVHFIDISQVPVVGSVYAANTGDAADHPFGCPMRAVEVCLYEKVRGYRQACGLTNNEGNFAVPAPIGTSMRFELEYFNHTFQRVNNEAFTLPTSTVEEQDQSLHFVNREYFEIPDSSDRSVNVAFKSITRTNIKLQMAGGLCNRTLGRTYVELMYSGCPNGWTHTIGFDTYEHTVSVPALQWDVRLARLVAGHGIFDQLVPEAQGKVGNRIQRLDARDASASQADASDESAVSNTDQNVVRWEYHPVPTMSVTLSASPPNQCDQLVISSGEVTDVTVAVSEKFWGDVEDCTWIEGNVSVTNRIGASTEEAGTHLEAGTINNATMQLLTKCSDTCILPLELEFSEQTQSYHSAKVVFTTMAGEPETITAVQEVMYAKSIVTEMHIAGSPVSSTVPVVVQGDKLISDKLIMDFPEYFPLSIIYDPPGDGSSSWYRSMKSSFSITSHHIGGSASVFASAYVGMKVDAELDSCAGQFALVCKSGLKIEGGAGSTIAGSVTIGGGYTNQGGVTLTSEISIQTSDSLSTGPLIVTPVLSVVFKEVFRITYLFKDDPQGSCEAIRETKTVWGIGKGPGGSAFSITTIDQIKDQEVWYACFHTL